MSSVQVSFSLLPSSWSLEKRHLQLEAGLTHTALHSGAGRCLPQVFQLVGPRKIPFSFSVGGTDC